MRYTYKIRKASNIILLQKKKPQRKQREDQAANIGTNDQLLKEQRDSGWGKGRRDEDIGAVWDVPLLPTVSFLLLSVHAVWKLAAFKLLLRIPFFFS